MASVPPNLARHGEIVSISPFNYLFGTFLHPLDPVNREIQVGAGLKARRGNLPEGGRRFSQFCGALPGL